MLHRRDALLRLGQVGLGGATLPHLLAAPGRAQSPAPTAKNCIFLFMWGGQPQQDMWDLKPLAPDGIRSRFAPIDTTVPGLQICDQMPQVARQADKLAVVRSVNHTVNVHDLSVHHAMTGRPLPVARSFPGNGRRRSDFPHVGSGLARFLPQGDMPASVSIPRPVGHDGVLYAGTHAGFLGSRYDPLEMGSMAWHANTGLAGQEQPSYFPSSLPADMDLTRLQARHGLLKLLNAHDQALQAAPPPGPLGALYEDAFRLLVSPAARTAFDLEQETPNTRDRYGRNEYGESYLVARRLIEAGVRLVSVNWMHILPNGKVYNVWDTHGGIADLPGGGTGYSMLTADYCLPAFDQAYSALLEDLNTRGLLGETLVACLGEFGRTPRINGVQGRDHWPNCYSAVFAGGGIQGGQIYGASDAQAAYVQDRPVAPEDLLATIYHACGLDPETAIHDLEGRPWRLCEGRPLAELF